MTNKVLLLKNIIFIYVILCVSHFIWPFAYSMTLPLAWLAISSILTCNYSALPALFFSLLGDIMGYQHHLFFQICFFAIAQLSYVIILLPIPRNNPRLQILTPLLCLFILLGVSLFILPKVPSGILTWSIFLYACLLLTMCGTACLHGFLLGVGACLFVLSDTLIGVNLFMQPIPHAHLAIMITYYLAQVLLFYGIYNKKRKVNL